MRLFVLLPILVLAFAAGTADASQLIDRNAHDVSLAVNAKGEALLTYTAGGTTKHVLAWGAVNAIAPTPNRKQVEFDLDYAEIGAALGSNATAARQAASAGIRRLRRKEQQ